MGAYTSIHIDNNEEPIKSHPRNPDWVVAHSKATKLGLAEVERLWTRFQQLGCNQQGTLSQEVLRSPVARNDKFVACILVSMFDSSNEITFLSFLRTMQWAEKASPEEKVKVVFSLFQCGEPVSKEDMFKILKATYINVPDETVRNTTDAFMQELDPENTGYINEAQFMGAAEKLPQKNLESLSQFRIVPVNVLDEAYKIFNMSEKVESDPYKKIPSTELLKNISGNIRGGHIETLAERLGFSSTQLQNIKREHPTDTSRQVEELLTQWRDRLGSKAYSGELKKFLVAAQMNEAAKLVRIGLQSH